MKIALFSDVHGNLPALEAVLTAIDQYAPDKTYCLGDLVNFAPFTNEVIDLIRKRNIPTIMGNHDDGVGNRKQRFPFSGSTEKELSAGQVAIGYTNKIINEPNRQFLKGLPPYIHVSTGDEMGYIDLLLAHGSPRDNDEYIGPDYDEEALLKMMTIFHADILAVGHTHEAYCRVMKCCEYKMNMSKQVVNVGSVGRPTDGDWRAAYCIMEFDHHSNLFDESSMKIEIRRVEYDIQRTYDAIIASPIPDIYAETLLKAGKK